MDGHQRRDHRAHGHRSRDLSGHHRRDHRRRQESEHVDKRSSKILSKGDEKGRQHLEQSLAEPALSSDKDYVRRWLTQTEKEHNPDDGNPREREREHRRDDDLARSIHHIGNPVHPQFGQEDDFGRRKSKRKRNSSTDSSLLEAPVRTKAQPLISKAYHDSPENPQKAAQVDEKRKFEPVEKDVGSVSSEENRPEEIFEKRARHKTKEDRYEPKKKRQKSEKPSEKKRPSTKPEKKSDRRKAARKAGEDLIRNFSSKNIGQERLTIRPSHGLGLFKNGRASSPAKRRVLPDLAFSEMEFLHHRHHTDPKAPGTVPEKISSKHREKDKRKVAKAQDEISTFFKPTKIPLREIDPNSRGRASSIFTAHEDSIYGKQVTADDYQHKHRHSRLAEPRKGQTLSFGQGTPSERLSARREILPRINHAARSSHSPSRISRKAETYITWSEGQLSHGAATAPRPLQITNQHSSTPESIRRSLRNTGVYRDTGIRAHPKTQISKARSPSEETLDQRHGLNVDEKIRRRLPLTEGSGTTTSSMLSVTRSSKENTASLPRHKYQETRNPQEETYADLGRYAEENHVIESGVTLKDRKANSAMNGKKRIIIEHFDSELGWHQRPSSRAQIERDLAEVMEETRRAANSTPITREQLAKLARVKRPATTLRAARLIGEESVKRNSPLIVAPEEVGLSVAVPGEKQSQRTLGETPPTQALPGASNADESRSTSRKAHGEELQTFRPKSTQQVDERDSAIQFAENKVAEECSIPPSVKPRSDSSIQASKTEITGEAYGRFDNNSYLGLPIRGGWNQRVPTLSIQPVGRLPIEVEPLFIHQVQGRHTPGIDHLMYENQPTDNGFLDIAHTDVESNLYLENPPTSMSAYQHIGIAQDSYDQLLGLQENDLIQQHDTYNPHFYEESKENMTGYAHETQPLQAEEADVSGLENFETESRQRQDPLYQHETFEEIPAAGQRDLVRIERPAELTYNAFGDESSHPLQGFWKARRQY